MYALEIGFQHGTDPIEWGEETRIPAASRKAAIKALRLSASLAALMDERPGRWRVVKV
jgi:hypothetical protein